MCVGVRVRICVLPGVCNIISLSSCTITMLCSVCVCVVALSVGECEWVHEPSGCY